MSATLEEARAYLAKLDLDYIVKVMCATSYPLPRWTEDDAKRCAHLYKNFLFLHKKHAGTPLVPTHQIDEFWHNHILHTQQYSEDCHAIFGHYLHHVPASPDDNTDYLVSDYVKTKTYYLAEFNEPLELIR